MSEKTNSTQIADTILAWDVSQEEVLLTRQLLSSIEKCGDRISITLSGKGVSALAKAIMPNNAQEEELLLKDETKDQDALISKKEVMEKFNVSDTTLWLWGKKNYLTPVKIGRKVMYRLSDIKKIGNGQK